MAGEREDYSFRKRAAIFRGWLAWCVVRLLPISQTTPRWASDLALFLLPYVADWAYPDAPGCDAPFEDR